jgi:hypothetical protein
MSLSTIGESPPASLSLLASMSLASPFIGKQMDEVANDRRVSRDASQKSVLERQRVGF